MIKMNYYHIDFNGKKFPYRVVRYKVAGHYVLIGSTSFKNELVDEDGSYKSDYAKKIYNKFYGFVDDKLFNTLTYDEFVEFINQYFN